MPDRTHPPQAEAYYIPKFHERHANAELSRKPDTVDWFWVRFPTDLSNLGLRRLMQTPQGREAFALYTVLVEMAANGRPRGVLCTRSEPMTTTDISLMSSIPTAAVEAGLALLTSDPVRWLAKTPFTPGMPFPGLPTVDPGAVPTDTDTDTNGIPTPDASRTTSRGRSRSTGNAVPGPPGMSFPPPPDLIAGGSFSDSPGGAGGAGLAGVLHRIGIPDDAVGGVLADRGDLTAAEAVAVWADVAACKDVKHVGRVVAKRLRDAQSPPALTAKAVLLAAKAGIVHHVNGKPIARDALRHNGKGLLLDGSLLAPIADLQAGSIALA